MFQCNLKYSKAKPFGTSVLVCFALSTPVVADDFVITGSDNSTNGIGTTNGGTAAAIADVINGSDTVSLGIAMTEPPHLNRSSAMFRKRRTDNDEQTTEAGRDYHEVEAS